jgi:hypothetical protein
MCSKEEPGVLGVEPSLSLSVERFTIRGSDDYMLEEAYLGS